MANDIGGEINNVGNRSGNESQLSKSAKIMKQPAESGSKKKCRKLKMWRNGVSAVINGSKEKQQ
jgi:hypothetical protein